MREGLPLRGVGDVEMPLAQGQQRRAIVSGGRTGGWRGGGVRRREGEHGAGEHATHDVSQIDGYFAVWTAFSAFRPRVSSSGSTLGSRPRKARYIASISSVPPRESTMSRKR